MITEAIINLGIVGFTCLILILYLIRFVLKYKHEYESNPLCTITVLFCLLIVLLAAFILPVDIFLVSFVKEPDGTFKQWATNETLTSIDQAVFAAYYSLYGITTLLIFVVIPFLHFFNEETESNSRDRLHNAIKYTFVSAVFMTLILVFGALINNKSGDPNEIFNKIINLTNMTKIQDALSLVLAILTAAGFSNVAFYTASGIFSWPIGLLLGTSSVASRYAAMCDRETILRMRISNLRDKASVTRLTPQECEELVEAENDLRVLEREEIAITNYRSSLVYKMRGAIRPFQIIVGSLLTILSVFLIVTLAIVNVDRILHGAGPKQGYILLDPQIFNPLEYVYTKLQDLLFIGPMPLLIVTCFLVVATISGIRNLGLWFLFARLHRVKIGRTQPQALLYFCITIMLAALSFNLLFYSMTTQYVTFGNQNLRVKDSNGTWTTVPCSLNHKQQDCLLTRSSILLMRMMSQVWIFGAIFYWWVWAFIVVSTISLIAYLIRGKRSATHGIVTSLGEFEE